MADRGRYIRALRCPRGALFLHDHAACTTCGGALTPVRISSQARLISHTTVRVNPSGEPYRIGVAMTARGAATLCIVEGRVRGDGHERVRLEKRNGRFHALAARARVTRRSRVPLPSAGDSQKS